MTHEMHVVPSALYPCASLRFLKILWWYFEVHESWHRADVTAMGFVAEDPKIYTQTLSLRLSEALNSKIQTQWIYWLYCPTALCTLLRCATTSSLFINLTSTAKHSVKVNIITHEDRRTREEACFFSLKMMAFYSTPSVPFNWRVSQMVCDTSDECAYSLPSVVLF